MARITGQFLDQTKQISPQDLYDIAIERMAVLESLYQSRPNKSDNTTLADKYQMNNDATSSGFAFVNQSFAGPHILPGARPEGLMEAKAALNALNADIESDVLSNPKSDTGLGGWISQRISGLFNNGHSNIQFDKEYQSLMRVAQCARLFSTPGEYLNPDGPYPMPEVRALRLDPVALRKAGPEDWENVGQDLLQASYPQKLSDIRAFYDDENYSAYPTPPHYDIELYGWRDNGLIVPGDTNDILKADLFSETLSKTGTQGEMAGLLGQIANADTAGDIHDALQSETRERDWFERTKDRTMTLKHVNGRGVADRPVRDAPLIAAPALVTD